MHKLSNTTWLLLATLAIGAESPADEPAPSAVRGSQYPRLHPNGTVTFRVTAREAKHVQVSPRGTGNGLGDKPIDLVRGDGGIWTAIAPARPGFHYYQLLVDGFPCNDPSSKTFFWLGTRVEWLGGARPCARFLHAEGCAAWIGANLHLSFSHGRRATAGVCLYAARL